MSFLHSPGGVTALVITHYSVITHIDCV